ncbi:SH3-like domain-containing protein [Loktanella atrilutea]|uniref:SH3-like domain-containing protein n=1 Tax=Loktanella atrilutea TaxID=366533 RepID=A0A1M4ZWP0_LOKAT|nr:SH3-like domain-containing protein [Loktanella atrilutea]
MLVSLTLSAPLAAQDATPETMDVAAATSASFTAPDVGPETNLPLPRYVSLKAKEANVRRGPSLTHRIDWVFKRRDMPLQVVAEYGHWRRVVDRDGQGGWVHYTMLSGVRTVIVDQDRLALRTKPSDTATERAELEQNVIARLGECDGDWCELTAGGYTGWAHRSVLWGVDDAE